jgi:hypothetical protein
MTARVLPLRPPERLAPLFHDLPPEHIADVLPWFLTEVRVVLERKNHEGTGRWCAAELAELAYQVEALCAQWDIERQAIKPL